MVEPISFGMVTDCQYADIPTPPKNKREYRMSPAKLAEAVDKLNSLTNLAFTIHLGDMIDQDFASFATIMPIFRRLKMPRYQTLGNHDYEVAEADKPKVEKALDLKSAYYAWEQKGWRFIVLDGSDVSLFSKSAKHPRVELAKRYRQELNPQLPAYNGAVGQAQLEWLRHELDQAVFTKQPVIVFCHYPALPVESHALWNAGEVTTLLAEYTGTVKAFFCGHNHDGNYAAKNGIHYLNFKGMVDTKQNTFAHVELTETGAKVVGYGREPHRDLPFPAPDHTPPSTTGVN